MDPPPGQVLGLLALNDDLLTAILILLTLADLGRACASCSALRRVITSPSFLRRLHARHPPPLLGLRAVFGKFQPVEPPNPVTRAIAAAADFRLSFLPKPGFWIARDGRGGRFVLEGDVCADWISTKIVVCDPLFRRYVLLPPIPQDMAAAAVEDPLFLNAGRERSIYDVFLAEEEAAFASPQSFRVIWLAQCTYKLVIFIFSSASGQWRAIPPVSWRDLDSDMPAASLHGFNSGMPALFTLTHRGRPLGHRSYAYGCFYWLISSSISRRSLKLIMLDMSTMELSLVNPPLPSGHRHTAAESAIMELGENIRGMLKLVGNNFGYLPSLQLFRGNSQNHGEDASEWVLENEVSLPSSYMYAILGDAGGKLFLQGKRKFACSTPENFCCMSVDFKTMRLQMVRESLHTGSGLCMPALYTGYPPSLSSPTV